MSPLALEYREDREGKKLRGEKEEETDKKQQELGVKEIRVCQWCRGAVLLNIQSSESTRLKREPISNNRIYKGVC